MIFDITISTLVSLTGQRTTKTVRTQPQTTDLRDPAARAKTYDDLKSAGWGEVTDITLVEEVN